MGSKAEIETLRRVGAKFEVLKSGCCGMAGAFGFEAGEPYRVSIQCGERVLLSAVRQAAPGQLVITNGFSCHEQIQQQTGSHALHLAEFLRDVLQHGVKPAAEPRRTPRTISAPVAAETVPVLRAGQPVGYWVIASLGVAAFLLGKLWFTTRDLMPSHRHHSTIQD